MPEKINIIHDGSFDIAFGRSRWEKNWKNKEMMWSDLVEKLSTTHYTAETQPEYMAAKKARQDEIKDVGGFIGGFVSGGRKKAGNILHRQLVTLDIDFSTKDFWEDLVMLYGNAAVVYSTHKHSPDSPRLRLIMPLSRAVRPDEYEAISRSIAGSLDIELFDPSTFQPERMMYWPSTSKGAEYEYHVQDGAWIDADAILNAYHDWRDSSSWPVSARVDKILQRNIAKQGDPLEKPGVIGAFCRTFSLSEAIDTFLNDVYEACDTENRYTYKEGSTAAGLVVYDDKYAYSHHGTDPTGGKLCNAFDLVRIHKFGLKDEDVREGTPGNKLPSYTAMIELATKEPKVKKLLVSEKVSDAQHDFENIEPIEEETQESDDWKEKLDVDRKGNIYNTIDNVLLILENDPYFKGRIAYDDFEKCEVAVKNLPWRKITQQTRRLIDRDDANMIHYLEKTYGISSEVKVSKALQVLSHRTLFHPVKDYLNSAVWDGQSRVDELFITYQGAADTPYTRIVTRKTLVAAVTRIFRPGHKFDNIIVLVGKQGRKKSTVIDKLGGQWYSDTFSFEMIKRGKEAYESLQGVWILEVPEMSGLDKASVNSVKAFVSKKEDYFRVAFGKRSEKFPRSCIIFSTTNKWDFLHDPTGDRRYWPILVNVTPPKKDAFEDLTENEVKQIWAEAMHYYKKGEKVYLTPDEELMALEVQKNHTEEHPWAGVVRQYLAVKLPEDWNKKTMSERFSWLRDEDALKAEGVVQRSRVCIHEIWSELYLGKGVIDERSARTLHEIMRNTDGWILEPAGKRYGIYGLQRNGYFRSDSIDFLTDSNDENGVTKVLQSAK